MKTIDLEGIKTLNPEAIFSVGETAKLLGLTHNGILTRMKRGSIRYGKSDSRYFILGSEIQKQIRLPEEIEHNI